MSTEREKIHERIRQLLGRTTSRGCTEAEAMEAAAKAAELMARHGLSEDDLVIEEETSTFATRSHMSLRLLWAAIGMATNTAAINMARAKGDVVRFMGVAPGPEIAVYLRDVCHRAVKTELAAFKAGEFYRRRRNTATRKAAVADFLDAMARRLSVRLLDLFEATRSQEAMDRAVAHRDRNFRTSDLRYREEKARFDEAANAGHRAGGRVPLAHGVSAGGNTPLLIGKGDL